MAIKFVKSLSGENAPLMHTITAGAAAVAADVAVSMTAGKGVVATGKPAYISMGAAEINGLLPVQDVLPHFIWETTFSAAAASVNVGDKVTLTADGSQATATTASGVATVCAIFGTTVGSKVHVRFE